jgi:MoxR-like ATPase
VRVDGSDDLAAITDGRVRCHEFPFVVLTSNGERDFPGAFLRRCIRLRMPDPTPKLLTQIVSAHLGPEAAQGAKHLISDFIQRTENSQAQATDQLMNAVYLVSQDLGLGSDERARVVELVLKQLSADVS